MKKYCMIVLTLLLLCSLSVTALAAGGGFAADFSVEDVPTIVEGPADLRITPYAARTQLDADDAEIFKSVYAHLSNTEDLSTLCMAMRQTVTNKGLDAQELSVGALFDLRTAGGAARVGLSSDAFEGFVALLCFKNGAWELVADASVAEDVLSFTANAAAPYAVVVRQDTAAQPQANLRMLLLLAVAVAIPTVVVLIKSAKRSH